MADRRGHQVGNYRLIRLLGSGGFAEVYLAEHVHLGLPAAVKLLTTQLGAEEVAHFREEARAIALLKHPNIVRLLDFGVEGGIPYLVMEYAAQGTLRQRFPKSTPQAPATILPAIQQIGAALQYAHDQRVIHRDVKPENLLVGERGEVLLSDFGIAVVSQSSRYQSTQDVVGTIAYMAPEQIQAHPRPASDQYSLGVVIYEWLTGDRPFLGGMGEVLAKQIAVPPPPLRERVPTLAPEVEQVVLTALAKEPKDRFATIHAFATAFATACQREREHRAASPVSVPSRPTSPAPAGSGVAETWLLHAPTQMSAPPLPVEAASETAGSEQPPDTALPTPKLAPPTPAVPPPVEVPRPAPATQTSEVAAARSAERVPQPPGRRRPARARRLVATGLSAGLIAVLVALLLLTRVAPRGTPTNALATASAPAAATHQAMQTSTALAGAATATTQSQQATATIQSQQATTTTQSQQATATAQVFAPYSAPVPGPCGSGTGSGTWEPPSSNQTVVCLSDRLRLLVTQPRTLSGVAFVRQPFPLNYTVSLEISGLAGNPYVNFEVSTVDFTYAWDFYQDGSWELLRGATGATSSAIIAQGGFDPTATTTLAVTVQGTGRSFLLNNRQISSSQEARSSPTTDLGIGVGIATGPGPAQADFQNFVFTPLA